MRLLRETKINYPNHFREDLITAYGNSQKLHRAMNGKAIQLGEFIEGNLSQSWRSGEFLKRWIYQIEQVVPGFTDLEAVHRGSVSSQRDR